MHHSNLSKLRKRFGVKGIETIDAVVFNLLRITKVIDNDSMLIDSTVLLNNIVYPTDIGLIFKAFKKMEQVAKHYHIPIWWDAQELKQLWREYNLNRKKNEFVHVFFEFLLIFSGGLRTFKKIVQTLEGSDKDKEKVLQLLELLILFQQQNEQKLAGEKHIPNRIVSFDESDARPIKKGKKHPDCEFGSTLQLSFNRQGFMVTTENFIGKPNDKTLWPETARLFEKKMKGAPEYAIGDKGYRSRVNQNIPKAPQISSSAKVRMLTRKNRTIAEKPGLQRKALSQLQKIFAVLVSASIRKLRGTESGLFYVRLRTT